MTDGEMTALEDAWVDTLDRFKIRYRDEIFMELEKLPRPRPDPLRPMLAGERQRQFDEMRQEAILKLWMRYRVIVLRRAASREQRDPVVPDGPMMAVEMPA